MNIGKSILNSFERIGRCAALSSSRPAHWTLTGNWNCKRSHSFYYTLGDKLNRCEDELRSFKVVTNTTWKML